MYFTSKVTLDELKQRYLNAEVELSAARKALQDAALEVFHLHVGNVIEVSHRGKATRAQITKIEVSVHSYKGKVSVELKPSVFPFKKDGTVAKVGELFIWSENEIKVIS